MRAAKAAATQHYANFAELMEAAGKRLAIGPKTAMIDFFTTPLNETGPMSLESIARIARPHGVPIMVGATLVLTPCLPATWRLQRAAVDLG